MDEGYFTIVYVKDGNAHSVPVTEEQLDMLNVFVPVMFKDNTVNVLPEVIGTIAKKVKADRVKSD